MNWSNICKLADPITIISGAITILTLFNTFIILLRTRCEKKRLDQDIIIKLVSIESNQSYLIPKLKRREFNRPEILGRIGMIPIAEKQKKERFSIDYLNTDGFIECLYEVQNSNRIRNFEIKCTDKELEQFNFKIKELVV